MFLLLNAALYQAGWVACILGAANGAPWLGPAAAVAILGWHLARARRPRQEVRLLAICAAAGAVFETAMLLSGWVGYPPGTGSEGTVPLWIVTLWALFATTFNVSLRGLRDKPGVAALLGAIGAPLAYYAGARSGALDLVAPGAALAAIAAGWAIATPMLLGLARRFDGYAAT